MNQRPEPASTWARADAPEPTATIRAGDAPVTFVQIWNLGSTDAQDRWLDIMHSSIDVLRTKPGFVTMTLHASLDGTRIAVYAQWTSQETLDAAISEPQAVAAHERMAQIGYSDGSLYSVARVYGPITR